jgi:hypothetical protein
MKKKIFYASTLVMLLILTGCGYKEGVISASQKAYLYFTGNTSDVLISVDKGATFSVENGREHQYKIAPGKHLVEVYRGQNLILKREIFVSDEVAKEIEIK